MDSYVAHAASTDMSAEAGRTVVWLAGQHDTATVAELSGALSWAVELDEHDVVVDLNRVEFMDASTLGVIIRTRNRLRARSRSLTLRSPSRRSERLLNICGLTDLIEAGRSSPLPAQSRVDARMAAIARRM